MSEDTAKGQRFLQHLEPLQGALESYCRRSLNNPGDVEDVLQSAIVKAYRDFHLYVEGTNFRAWIFRYLNTEIYVGNRRFQQHQQEPLVGEPAVEDVWEFGSDESLLEQLLNSPELVFDHCDQALVGAIYDLDPLERCVLLLRAIGRFKHREMAEILAVPIGSVMSASTRARHHLRRRLFRFAQEQGLLPSDSLRKRKG